MEVSGEVADLLVKEGLEAARIATELSAKGLVHAAALLAAMVKQNYKVVGKVGIEKLMKETNAESVIIPIKAADYEKFQKIAKQFGVLYAAVKHESKETGVMHMRRWITRCRKPERRKSPQKKRSPALHKRSPQKSAGMA